MKMPPAHAPLFSYRAYGCNLLSDVELVRLSPGSDPALDTITIQRCETLPDRPDDAKQIGPFAWAAPNYLSLNIDEIVHLVARDGKTLKYLPHEGIDEASVQLFLMGSGLGALLMQRQLLVMHGNAVEINGTCVMCVGPSGVGKSTTAAGLMQRGFRVMSDDICAINQLGQIIPGMPHIKLWQEAADGLGMGTTGLDRVRPEMEKYGVPLHDAFCEDFVPIQTIYLLTTHNSAKITCETLSARDKFMALRFNTYRLPFVAGMGLSAVHFQQVTALSQRVAVKRITRPQSGFHLDRLLDTLIADATRPGGRA